MMEFLLFSFEREGLMKLTKLEVATFYFSWELVGNLCPL